jgi:AraC family transcriptional regulator
MVAKRFASYAPCIDAAGPVLRLPHGAIERLARQTHRLLAHDPMLAGEASAAAYDAIMALHDGVFGADEVEVEALPPAIARARQYIDAHLGEQLDIERLARTAQ